MNKTSFTIVIKEQISRFTVAMFDFFKTSTLFARIKILLRITASASLQARITIAQKIKGFKLSISKMNLLYSVASNVNLHSIKMTITSKAIGKLTVNIKSLFVRIVATTKAIMKLTSTLNLHRIKMTVTATLGNFTELVVHDPELLSVVDPQTLEDLDFTTV